MDQNEICQIVSQVFKAWSDSESRILDIYSESVRFIVISDRFSGLGLENRINLVRSALDDYDASFLRKYLISVEPFTKAEFASLPTEVSIDDKDAGFCGTSVAARSPEV